MPSTHLSLYYHLVFSTKNREPWFTDELLPRAHVYLGGCVRTAGGVAEAIGGVDDHVHILVSLRSTHRLADVLHDVKQKSSEWFHEATRRFAFAWQEGYGAFSYGHSQLNTIIRYIQNQERHHQKRSFKVEYLTLLRKFDIAFDDKYVFKFIE